MLDRGLAAVIGAAGLLGLVGLYFATSAGPAEDNQIVQINTIAIETNRLYASQGGQFTTLSETVIAQTAKLPAAWTNATLTGLTSVYKSMMTLAPTTNPVTTLADGAWTMTIANVPIAACAVLGTTLFTQTMLGTTINGTVTGTAQNPIGDPATVTSACRAAAADTANVPTMTFTFS